ncbi:MAG: hypothetical protein JWM02_1001 [Frankiales bacterium]|nr:hypothetical protein [Frankiales bacterium]
MLELDDGDGAGRPVRRRAATLVRLTSSRSGVPDGEPLALTAHVRAPLAGAPAPTGWVAFRVAGELLGTAMLDGAGQAALDGVRLDPGVHALTASYGGDENHAAASSAPLPQAVTVPPQPVVVLVPAPEACPAGVLLQAELVDARTGRRAEAASGSVVFSAGSSTVACADLVAGHAGAVVPDLPPGQLDAAFAGDPEHAPATGSYVVTDGPVGLPTRR